MIDLDRINVIVHLLSRIGLIISLNRTYLIIHLGKAHLILHLRITHLLLQSLYFLLQPIHFSYQLIDHSILLNTKLLDFQYLLFLFKLLNIALFIFNYLFQKLKSFMVPYQTSLRKKTYKRLEDRNSAYLVQKSEAQIVLVEIKVTVNSDHLSIILKLDMAAQQFTVLMPIFLTMSRIRIGVIIRTSPELLDLLIITLFQSYINISVLKVILVLDRFLADLHILISVIKSIDIDVNSFIEFEIDTTTGMVIIIASFFFGWKHILDLM